MDILQKNFFMTGILMGDVLQDWVFLEGSIFPRENIHGSLLRYLCSFLLKAARFAIYFSKCYIFIFKRSIGVIVTT